LKSRALKGWHIQIEHRLSLIVICGHRLFEFAELAILTDLHFRLDSCRQNQVDCPLFRIATANFANDCGCSHHFFFLGQCKPLKNFLYHFV